MVVEGQTKHRPQQIRADITCKTSHEATPTNPNSADLELTLKAHMYTNTDK